MIVLDRRIEDMDFGSPKVNTRIRNVLQRNGIMTLGDLVECSDGDLWRMEGIGAISISFIKLKLSELNLKLAPRGQ